MIRKDTKKHQNNKRRKIIMNNILMLYLAQFSGNNKTTHTQGNIDRMIKQIVITLIELHSK